MANLNSNSDITVVRHINTTTAQTTPSTKIPYTKCCPGLWLEAGILILIVIGAIIGFIKNIEDIKENKL